MMGRWSREEPRAGYITTRVLGLSRPRGLSSNSSQEALASSDAMLSKRGKELKGRFLQWVEKGVEEKWWGDENEAIATLVRPLAYLKVMAGVGKGEKEPKFTGSEPRRVPCRCCSYKWERPKSWGTEWAESSPTSDHKFCGRRRRTWANLSAWGALVRKVLTQAANSGQENLPPPPNKSELSQWRGLMIMEGGRDPGVPSLRIKEVITRSRRSSVSAEMKAFLSAASSERAFSSRIPSCLFSK